MQTGGPQRACVAPSQKGPAGILALSRGFQYVVPRPQHQVALCRLEARSGIDTESARVLVEQRAGVGRGLENGAWDRCWTRFQTLGRSFLTV